MSGQAKQAKETDYEREATRKRLLLAAGEVFAEHGFERATVREISQRAEANIAAIQYHFNGKFPLYQAAFRYWFDESHQRYVESVPPVPAKTPRARLRQFIGMFLNRILSPGKPAWHAKLMMREMIEPTGVLEMVVNTAMKPMLGHLEAIVREIVGTPVSRTQIERAMLSIIAQCVFYHHSKPVLQLLYPQHVNEPDIEAIAEHIAAFSYAGLKQLQAQKGRA